MLENQRRCRNSISVLAVCLALVGCGSPKELGQQSEGKTLSTADVVASESGISIETANRFHLALIARVLLRALEDPQLEIRYDGILATDTGSRSGQRVHGSVGAPLQWEIVEADGTPVFGVMITADRTSDTDISCTMGEKTVYVHVSFIQGIADINPAKIESKEIDKEREILGGQSIRKLLQHLEGPEDEIEKD